MQVLNLILNNGGGVTIQAITDKGFRYQHSWDGCGGFDGAAALLRECLSEDVWENIPDWEGNEAVFDNGRELSDEEREGRWMDYHPEVESNGGYRWHNSLYDWLESPAWGHADRELRLAFANAGQE